MALPVRLDIRTGWPSRIRLTICISTTYDNKYNSIVRIYGVAFVIDGQGYLTCGGTPDLRTNTWKYTPDTDLWEEVANFKGAPRTATASFSNGNKGFIVTGRSNNYRFDDIWELHPYEYDEY